MRLRSAAIRVTAVLAASLGILLFTVGNPPATGPRARIPPAPSFAPEITIKPDVATVVGKVVAQDWYLVVRTQARARPLIIWTKDRAECAASANQFNIKSVEPGRQAAPAVAACRTGSDIAAQFRS